MNHNNNIPCTVSLSGLCTQYDSRLPLSASPSSQENPSLVSLLSRTYASPSSPGLIQEHSSEETSGDGLYDILSRALDILDDSPFHDHDDGSDYDDLFACPKATPSLSFKSHSSPRQ